MTLPNEHHRQTFFGTNLGRRYTVESISGYTKARFLNIYLVITLKCNDTFYVDMEIVIPTSSVTILSGLPILLFHPELHISMLTCVVCVVFVGPRHIIVMLHISYASAIICKSFGICVRNSPLPPLKLKAKPPILAIRFFSILFMRDSDLRKGKKII